MQSQILKKVIKIKGNEIFQQMAENQRNENLGNKCEWIRISILRRSTWFAPPGSLGVKAKKCAIKRGGALEKMVIKKQGTGENCV